MSTSVASSFVTSFGTVGRSWRITTAVRVFALALLLGNVLSRQALGTVATTLLSLAVLAAAACLLGLGDRGGRVHALVAPGEAVVAATLIGTASSPGSPLFLYLAVPPLVAGIARGWVTAVNAALGAGFALVGSWLTLDRPHLATSELPLALTWLAAGLGLGLLAAWFGRSIRRLEDERAPYAAAHRLLTQLSTLAGRHRLGLDSRTSATDLLRALQERTAGVAGAVVVHRGVEPFRFGALPETQAALLACLEEGAPRAVGAAAAWPLRVGDQPFGAVAVLRDGRPWGHRELEQTQSQVDEAALRLETALTFEEVRDVATTEERRRVAREIHDGVAQEIAGLGYRLDDLAATAADPATGALARELRAEVSRVVGELRLSILDLRLDLPQDPRDFTRVLAEYVREVGARSGLRVHLLLDEDGDSPGPDPAAATELLRIFQEAVTNVRRHAEATNLWVTFASGPSGYRLEVVDDGIGAARAREGHFGLRTMRERAERVGLAFTVGDAPDGGTRVAVATPSTTPSTAPSTDPISDIEGENHVDQRAAR